MDFVSINEQLMERIFRLYAVLRRAPGMGGEGEKLIPINIEDEMKSSYIDYSMSVIVSRALPDVRDGLKPVHRRV